MPMTLTEQNGSFRRRLHEQLRRLRGKSQDSQKKARVYNPLDNGRKDATPATDSDSIATPSLRPRQSNNNSLGPNKTTEDEHEVQIHEKALNTDDPDQGNNTDSSTLGSAASSVTVSSDLWSAAYREAVDSLGDNIDIAILKGKNVALLFRELEAIDKDATKESAFLRGVGYLRDLQVPLERFKLALDLASPLTSIEPTSAAVFGVVRGVTAVAISFSTADLAFAKQIGEMLEQISYIDDCDTLGQKANNTDIHKALVQVYRQILEFYKAAFEMLTRRGAKLVMKIVLETDRLPNIVQEFLRHANNLGNLVQKATWAIVEDIKSMLYDREIARWLGSGRMSQQSQYHTSLQEIYAEDACKFLLRDHEFINWYRAPDSRQLVILGDIGCGKTVSMAFLIDTISRRSEHQLPQPKLCYYYCRDDESGQATQILSALILALLEQLPGLKKTFFDWYKQAQASGIFDPATNIRKLGEFLQHMVGGLDRPLFIVVDGLDECDRSSRNILLSLLRDLTERTPRLKVLLSSRPQEEILEQLGSTARVDLASNTERDRVIVTKTVETRLSYLTEDVKALVIERLSGMAQGNSIWTRSIVELIECRGIRALVPMSRFLKAQTLPRGVSELYDVLLSRCTSDDPENHALAMTALRVLATSRRTLSILEVSWAAMLGVASEEATTVAELAQLVDHKRLINLIQPFVSRVDLIDVKKRQVRLVHQSVKEWIIDYWVPGLSPVRNAAPFITPNEAATRRRLESLESHMLDICVKYLLLDEINSINLFSEEQVAVQNLPQTSDLFGSVGEGPIDYDVNCSWEAWEEGMIRYDPIERGLGELFIYASCHWIDHYGAISLDPFPDLGRIEKLCQAGSTRLHNWIEQNRRPDCAINPRFEFDSSLYDPLSITSIYGSQAMLQHMLDTSDFDGDAFLPHSVMKAGTQIIRWADMSRLRIILLESRVGNQVQIVDFFLLIMRHWTNFGMWRHDWNIAFNLVDEVVDRLVRDGLGNELLCLASRRGCMPIIQRLMERSRQHAELRRELLRGTRLDKQLAPPAEPVHQSIGEAVMGDHIDVVEYLLHEEGIEAHVSHINSRGENVLHLASKVCNPAIFRLLIPLFPDGLHQKDNEGDTPLIRVVKSSAASDDRYELVKILLAEDGMGENGYSLDELQACLGAAVRLEDVDMCSLLMEVDGIDLPLVSPNGDEGLEILDPPAGDQEQVENLYRLQHANAASMVANSMAPLGEQEGQIISGLINPRAQLGGNAARQEPGLEDDFSCT